MKAVECDPKEGDAWFGLWIEGMRTGRVEIEKRALTTLVSSGFITPGALAYARWILGALPKNAILLTNGDMDTYPLVTLQESAGFRRDVAIVDAGLLNIPWYGSLMTRRHRIAGGYAADEIWRLEEEGAGSDPQNPISRQLISLWLDARRQGTLKRPIAISVGACCLTQIGDLDDFMIAGPYWLHNTGIRTHRRDIAALGKNLLDTATLWSSLRTIRPADFKGYFVSPRDRSPIRRAYSGGIAAGAIIANLWPVVERMREVNEEEAEKLVTWIERFYIKTGTAVREEE
jgi:hypothetical protein